jgi:hypothetical protein
VIEALALVRRRKKEIEAARATKRDNDKWTARGVIVQFFKTTPYLVKRRGKFVQWDERLAPGDKLVEVRELQDGEVAQYLRQSTSNVKKARQFLAAELKRALREQTETQLSRRS